MMHFIRIAILANLLFFSFTQNASAFGVSPPYIIADRLTKGSHYEATIVLSQGQPKEDLKVKAVFDVPEKIRSWFSVVQGEEFVIPKGVQQFPIQVVIDVPKNADFGIYTGYLRVNTVPNRKEGEQIVIAVGGRIDISLTVGDNIISEFVIKKIEILDIREGEDPKIKIEVQNTGNVPTGPDRATFDLFDKYGNVRLGFAQVEDIVEEVPAFKTKSLTIKFPIDVALGVGEYWAEAKIYRGEGVVKELKTVFDVSEKNLIADLLSAVKENLAVSAIILAVIIVLAGGLFIKKRFSLR
jgi:hypothetical protein